MGGAARKGAHKNGLAGRMQMSQQPSILADFLSDVAQLHGETLPPPPPHSCTIASFLESSGEHHIVNQKRTLICVLF